MRPFRALLEHPAYWSLHRDNVTLAVALGIFVSFIPLPVHMVAAAALALAIRINIPVAVASVYVSNPLTMFPQYYLAYRVGAAMLGGRPRHFAFEMSWSWIHEGFLPIWKPLLLGCLTLGAASAAIAYVLLGGIWRLTLVLKYHQRKRRDNQGNSANARN